MVSEIFYSVLSCMNTLKLSENFLSCSLSLRNSGNDPPVQREKWGAKRGGVL